MSKKLENILDNFFLALTIPLGILTICYGVSMVMLSEIESKIYDKYVTLEITDMKKQIEELDNELSLNRYTFTLTYNEFAEKEYEYHKLIYKYNEENKKLNEVVQDEVHKTKEYKTARGLLFILVVVIGICILVCLYTDITVKSKG